MRADVVHTPDPGRRRDGGHGPGDRRWQAVVREALRRLVTAEDDRRILWRWFIETFANAQNLMLATGGRRLPLGEKSRDSLDLFYKSQNVGTRRLRCRPRASARIGRAPADHRLPPRARKRDRGCHRKPALNLERFPTSHLGRGRRRRSSGRISRAGTFTGPERSRGLSRQGGPRSGHDLVSRGRSVPATRRPLPKASPRLSWRPWPAESPWSPTRSVGPPSADRRGEEAY